MRPSLRAGPDATRHAFAPASRRLRGRTPEGPSPQVGRLRRRARVLVFRQAERPLAGLLEVALLDRQRPLGELERPSVAGPLRHGLDDRPVAGLAGLRHGQELEAVERIRVVTEVGAHHLRRFLLGLAGLVEDRRLLAVERRRALGAPLLGLGRLLVHPLERRDELVASLLLDQPLDLVGRALGRHRQPQHLAELALEHRQLRHVGPPSSNWSCGDTRGAGDYASPGSSGSSPEPDGSSPAGTVTFSGSRSSPGTTVMSTSSSPLRSTMIVEPGVSSAPRTKSASGSSMWRWIARRSGRAPIAGS